MMTLRGWHGRSETDGPLVIGGLSGSGTRVYRAIAEAAGYSMLIAPLPARIIWREWHDNLLMSRQFYSRWIERYLFDELEPHELERMRAECRLFLWASDPFAYRRRPWGWKNPRTMYLIPFFKSLYPHMKYILALRDGRDHAFHPRYGLRIGRTPFLDERERELPHHLRRGIYWSRAIDFTIQTLEKELPNRHLVSRLEDLCSQPERETRRVMAFLGVDDPERLERARRLVVRPATLDRWRSHPDEQIGEVERLIGADLVRHGYPLVIEKALRD